MSYKSCEYFFAIEMDRSILESIHECLNGYEIQVHDIKAMNIFWYENGSSFDSGGIDHKNTFGHQIRMSRTPGRREQNTF